MRWPTATLGKLLALEYGSALPARIRDGTGHFPVAGSNGVSGYHSSPLVPGPGIVVGRKGSAGKVAWYDSDFWPIDTTYYVKTSLDLRWVFYLLNHLRLEQLAIVTGVPGLNREDAYRLKVDLPPPSEQRLIVKILDQAAGLRQLRDQRDAKAQRIVPALFLKIFGRPDDIVDWETLGDVASDFRYGTSTRSDENGYPALRIPNVVRGELDLSDLKNVPVSSKEFSRLRLQHGDLLLVRTNGNPDYVGRCAVFDRDAVREEGLDPDHFIYASYLIRVRLNLDKVEPLFIQTYLSMTEGRRALRAFSRTSAGQYNINIDALRSIPIPKIKIDQQGVFVSAVKSLQCVSALRQQSAARLDDLFNSLVHRAFSGDLTARWREAHKEELVREMQEQAKALGLSLGDLDLSTQAWKRATAVAC